MELLLLKHDIHYNVTTMKHDHYFDQEGATLKYEASSKVLDDGDWVFIENEIDKQLKANKDKEEAND